MVFDWAGDLTEASIVFSCLMFYAELITSVLLFSFYMKKKPLFWVRLMGSIIVVGGLSVLVVWLGYKLYEVSDLEDIGAVGLLGAIVILYLIAVFAVSIGTLRFCFYSNYIDAAFCGVCGYSVQHIVYRINFLMQYYLFFGSDSHFDIPLRFLVMGLVYIAIWFLFARKLKGKEHIDIENKRLLVFFGMVLLVMIIFSGLSLSYMGIQGMRQTLMIFIECGLAFIICILTLFTLFEGILRRDMERDNRRIHWLWEADRRHYELSKSNIEQLNIKFHDLKYLLRSIESDSVCKEEIDKCLKTYESAFFTENETLDVVLAEKSISGAKNGISISCIADGKCLAAMEPAHLYSLFGNALDNAIECLMMVDDAEKKTVDVEVRKVNEMTMVRISNYSPFAVKLERGMPATTKSDKANHGYGLKSIRNIVERYDGSMRIETKDERFVLTVLFPKSFYPND